MKENTATPKSKTALAWALIVTFGILLFSAWSVYPELKALLAVLSIALLGSVGFLVMENRAALRTRTASFGSQSFLTVLITLSIVAVLNFLAYKHPKRWDMTKEGLNTVSDQTVKVVKGFKTPIKAMLFSPVTSREKYRPLLEQYRDLNPEFTIEYVDIQKDITRVRQAGIKKPETLQLVVGTRDVKVEDTITEEKLTNALIKLSKEKSQVLCAITGHGEKNFMGNEADGYSVVRTRLVDQSYEVKVVNLMTEAGQKIPDSCQAIAIVGANKAFFAPELKAIEDYLANGGRAIIAFDVDVKGGENAPELVALAAKWHVQPTLGIVIDATSRLANLDASVPLMPMVSREHPITRDTPGETAAAFPFLRPLEQIPNPPAGLKLTWLAQTLPSSFLVTDFKQLATGQVKADSGKKGPFRGAYAVDGKLADSKATRNSRIVFFGSSLFAMNQFMRFGNNLDFFLNSVSWLLEDETLISIRAKEATGAKLELSERENAFTRLVTVILIPLFIAIGGTVIWAMRRKL